MREKEKMLAGELYRANDPRLVEERRRAKAICRRCNASENVPDAEMLRELLGHAADAYIEPPFFCDYGYNIRLGARFYANHGLVILDVLPVTIGDGTTIGAGPVVTNEIPANCVAAGNPCRVIRARVPSSAASVPRSPRPGTPSS